jgi:ABC-type transporter Mla subunit MlaD
MSRWDGEDRRKPVDSGNRLILEVPKGGNLDEVLRLIAQGGGGVQIPDLGFINSKLDLILGLLEGENGAIPAINNLDRKVDTMSSNIDRIEKEAADAAENVGLVKTALDTLNSTVADLKTMVADLQDQVAKGQVDQARLDAAASTLEKADDDLDALVLPPTPPTV